ncbi:MAG TPA: hypothetical protein VGH73_01685 [Thermoanaerobaculia bacterium]
MPVSPPIVGSRALVAALAVAALALPGAFGQDRPAPAPRFNAGETVDVEVKIVPFYAVDAKGNPVYDLKPGEVELRVGGAPIAIESFDSYVIPSGPAGAQASPLTPTPSRTVFFLFDTTFSSPAGFKTDKRLAARLVEGWPGGDRLFLILHGTRAGLERKLGPVPPDAQGKKELLAAIEALRPETRRVELQDDPTVDFSPPAGKASRTDTGAPDSQMAHAYNNIQGAVRGEYHSVARDLASSLGDFASELRRISGPKLLVLFSQGMNDELYFQGDSGFKVGSDESVEVDTRRAPPLVDRFREPLAALAESGTATLFVNTDRDLENDGDGVLRNMAQTTGGLYVEGKDPRDLEKRIAGSTAAYYEAGFHPAGDLLQKTRAGVEVVIRRPGVRAWAPAAVQTRESYRSLSDFEKRRMVIDLVAGGAAAQHAHSSAKLGLQSLTGKTVGIGKNGRPVLRFEAAWPGGLAARKLDLYNVVLALPTKETKGKILQFEKREGIAAVDQELLETPLQKQFAQTWGIVAVDPDTEQLWLCRLLIQPP